MSVTHAELQPVLQRLADEISLLSRQVEAHRFLVQALYVSLQSQGRLSVDKIDDPIKMLVSAAYGSNGQKPNSELFSTIMDIIDGRSAEVIAFKPKQ